MGKNRTQTYGNDIFITLHIIFHPKLKVFTDCVSDFPVGLYAKYQYSSLLMKDFIQVSQQLHNEFVEKYSYWIN